MSNSSLPPSGAGLVSVPVAAVGSSRSGGGSGVVIPDFAAWCRNLSNVNSTKPGMATTAVEDTDFGAVLYIVVVLTFYSFGIVVMIVKYLKTEKKEMEEEMVLDSFFKGIPDKRIENEKEAVNRVAIQAFHTLTTSKQSRGLPQSSKESGRERRSAAANPHKKLTSPASYRRERYSIQPMFIGASRQLDDDELSDCDDKTVEENDNDIDRTFVKHPGRCRVKHCALEIESEVGAEGQRAESKPHKSVLFSDTPSLSDSKMKRECMENKHVRSKNKDLSKFSLSSTSNYRDGSDDNISGNLTSDIRPPVSTEMNSPDFEIKFTNTSNSKPNRIVTAATFTAPANTLQSDSLENVALNSFSPPRNKPPMNARKGVLSTRNAPKGVLVKHPLCSPDLGAERNLFRMSSIEKGIGDGSSYDSSSSLLTRIQLADTFTPPLRAKNRQDTGTNMSAGCRSNNGGDNSGNCSSNVNYPFTIDTDNSDEKLKLTAGKNNMSPMQTSYDSTASTKGLTTRVNIMEPSGDRNTGSKSCLVTDL